jgi:hypothetical protein
MDVYLLESRGGFDRISFHYPSIAVDAWVPKGVVTETNSLTLDPPWSSFRRRPPKVLPRRPLTEHYARASHNVAVELQSGNGATQAALQRGAVVAIIERAGGRVGVKLADGRLDAMLWVADDDLTPCSPSKEPS